MCCVHVNVMLLSCVQAARPAVVPPPPLPIAQAASPAILAVCDRVCDRAYVCVRACALLGFACISDIEGLHRYGVLYYQTCACLESCAWQCD